MGNYPKSITGDNNPASCPRRETINAIGGRVEVRIKERPQSVKTLTSVIIRMSKALGYTPTREEVLWVEYEWAPRALMGLFITIGGSLICRILMIAGILP
jgi:hypothetical protein